jgi:hypothetical protein
VSSSGKRRRPTSRPRPAADSARNVFINCPFDDRYRPLFHAAVFAVVDCGFVPRCALEVDDGSEVRINKVCDLIGECRFGIHDLSRTELDSRSKLPRFNMPLELGLFIGAKRFGGASHRRKSCLILDMDSISISGFHLGYCGPGHQSTWRRSPAIDNGRSRLAEGHVATSDTARRRRDFRAFSAVPGRVTEHLSSASAEGRRDHVP